MVVRHIHRQEFLPLAVRGVMEGGGIVLHTLEDPEDLVEAGQYDCTRDYYHAGDHPTYLINHPTRSRLLFHAGNTHEDTLGCVLLGIEQGEINDVPAVLGSRAAFQAFMDSLDNTDSFTLVITETPSG